MEVAVEVDVQPQAFTERLRPAIVDGVGPVTNHRARAVVTCRSCDNRVSGQARPGDEIGIDGGRVAACQTDQIAGNRVSER